MALDGSWYINPLGEKLMGNDVLPVPASSAKAFQALRSDTPKAATKYLESLASGVDAKHPISPEEVQHVIDLHSQGEEVWELVKDFGGEHQVMVHRYKDASLFKGAMFGRLTAFFPSLSKEEVLYRCMNIKARVAWDKQVEGFDTYPAPRGNSVLRYRMNAPPFSLRDFVVFQVILCNAKDKSVMQYQRLADNSLFPPTRKEVRGRIPIMATLISDLPTGGVLFRNLIVFDPNLPIIPKWLINMFIPTEFKKWTECLRSACAEQAGRITPGQGFETWYCNLFQESTLPSDAAAKLIPADPRSNASDAAAAAAAAESSSQQRLGSATREQAELPCNATSDKAALVESAPSAAETQNSAGSLAGARQAEEVDNLAKALVREEAPANATVEIVPDQVDSSSQYVCCFGPICSERISGSCFLHAVLLFCCVVLLCKEVCKSPASLCTPCSRYKRILAVQSDSSSVH